MADKPRWLVFGIGNPSRGDDALGSSVIQRLEDWLDQPGVADALPVQVVLETDFQCQVEHALDLVGVSAAIFVDASVQAAAPFQFTPLLPQDDASHTTHAVSPACVLAVAQRIGQTLPDTWMLAIPGLAFELGQGLSSAANQSLDLAMAFLVESLRRGVLMPSL